MSASVSNYLFVMEERQRALRSTVRNNITESGVGVPANSSVKRCLFGAPDPVELKRKYDELHEEERKRGARKWGFDFETETPLENSRYQWERVTASSSSSVPKSYELSHLGPSQSPIHESESTTSSNHVDEEEIIAPSSPVSSDSSSSGASSPSVLHQTQSRMTGKYYHTCISIKSRTKIIVIITLISRLFNALKGDRFIIIIILLSLY